MPVGQGMKTVLNGTVFWQHILWSCCEWRYCFKTYGSAVLKSERVRIGKKIREIREEKGIEAWDLAKSANIDAANLSRIEQGKYSVGIDILSKLAFVLGYQIDIVPNQL